MTGAEVDIIQIVGQYGFPIAVAVYLLWERTKTFTEVQRENKEDRAVMLEIVKANTIAQTELRVTIQKLCEIVNGRDHA